MKKYNSVTSLSFVVEHDGEQPTEQELLVGIHRRLMMLHESGDEILEACLPVDGTQLNEEE